MVLDAVCGTPAGDFPILRHNNCFEQIYARGVLACYAFPPVISSFSPFGFTLPCVLLLLFVPALWWFPLIL